MDFTFDKGDWLEVKAGAKYRGQVTEKTDWGVWLTEDFLKEEFIVYVEITEWVFVQKEG